MVGQKGKITSSLPTGPPTQAEITRSGLCSVYNTLYRTVYNNLQPDSFTVAGGKWPLACGFGEGIIEFAVAVVAAVGGVLPGV